MPIYGRNRGSVGFLMNDYQEDGLLQRIAGAERAAVHPLRMLAIDAAGGRHDARLAINEVSLLRQTRQTAKLRLLDRRRGAHGGAGLRRRAGLHPGRLDRLQPISAWAGDPAGRPGAGPDPDQRLPPRRWRGAPSSHTAQVKIEVIEPDKRPVSAVADNYEVRDVTEVRVREARELAV